MAEPLTQQRLRRWQPLRRNYGWLQTIAEQANSKAPTACAVDCPQKRQVLDHYRLADDFRKVVE